MVQRNALSSVRHSGRPALAIAQRSLTLRSWLGIACLPEFAARDALAMGSLRRVLEEHTEVRLTTFRILWPSGKYPSPKLRAFIDFLAEASSAAHGHQRTSPDEYDVL
ncbi:MAG: hypothetical protein JSS56_25520 [Proteobacteria bacterium]|nr:hypothetical protein [Pseudomonadota bacterium]